MTTAGNENKDRSTTVVPAVDEALATWNERVEAWRKQVEEYQRAALENLANVQEAFAQELRKVADTGEPKDWSQHWPQVSRTVDDAFDFAVALLDRQRSYTKNVIEAAVAAAEK